MALPVPHCMGAKIPLPRFAGDDQRGRRKRNNGNLWLCWMRGSRVEYPARPCAFGGDDSAKAIDIRFVGTAERANVDEALPAVSAFEEKALLGQPLLGQGILC